MYLGKDIETAQTDLKHDPEVVFMERYSWFLEINGLYSFKDCLKVWIHNASISQVNQL